MNIARDTHPADPTVVTRSSGPQRKPLKAQVMGGYWRVPVLAVLGAVVAFAVSFVFQSQYSATTRLIIHPNDSSYAATDSGADVTGSLNIGGIDITKQTTLGNTLVNLATSDAAVAETVKRVGVEKINGTTTPPTLGTVAKIRNFLKSGSTGRTPTAEEAAVDRIEGSVSAAVLEDSWVMEITALDPDPQQAALIASTAADVAVEQSAARFRENSVRELEYLNQQAIESRNQVTAKETAVADFKAQLPLDPSPAQQVQLETLQADLERTRAANTALETRRSAVEAIAGKPRFDVSRLGGAVVSSSPARPMRYLFLMVGALVGALAGLLLTWFRSIREDQEPDGDDRSTASGRSVGDAGRPDVRMDEVVDISDSAVAARNGALPTMQPIDDRRSGARHGRGRRSPVYGSEPRATAPTPTAPAPTAPAPAPAAPAPAPAPGPAAAPAVVMSPPAATVPSWSSVSPSVSPSSNAAGPNGGAGGDGLSTSEAASIAAALFERPDDARHSDS